MKEAEALAKDAIEEEIRQNEVRLNETKGEADKEVEKLKATVDNLRREIADRDAQLQADTERVNARLEDGSTSIDRVRNYIKWMLLLAWFGSIGTFAGWYLLSKGLVLDIIILEGFVALGLLGVLFFAIIKRFPEELIADDLAIRLDSGRIETLSAAAASVSQDIQSVMRKFFPHLDMLMALVEKKHLQRILARTLKNALSHYNIHLNSKAERTLISFSSQFEGEEQWISLATEKLANDLGVSLHIISLSYYDFAGDQKGLRNSWAAIKADPRMISELALHLLTHRYTSLGIKQSNRIRLESTVDLLKSMDAFSLKEFDAIFSTFFVKLSEAKITLIEALQSFKFDLPPDLSKQVQDYLPIASEREEWEQELVQFVADKMKEYPELVEVIFTSKSGNHARRKKAWEKIVHSDGMAEHFADILVQNQLISVAPVLTQNKAVRPILVDIMRGDDDFSIVRISRGVDSHIRSVANTLKEILSAAGQYNLRLSEDARSKLETMLPTKDVDEAILQHVAEMLGIEKDVLELLYYDYAQNEMREKMQLVKIIESGLAPRLAELLVSKKVINIPQGSAKEATNNLSAIVLNSKEFNLASLQSQFTSYADLLDHASKLTDHFREHGIDARSTTSINRLIELFSDGDYDEYERLKIICREQLRESDLVIEDEEFKESIIISILVLYLTTRHNTHSSESCQDASRHDIARKTLYHYVLEHEASRNRPGSTVQLREVIKKVKSSPSLDLRHIDLFQDGLATGYLPMSINALLSARFDSIENEFKGKREMLEKMLSEIKTEVTDFLNIQLNEDIVTQSLDSGLISAYMVTSAGKGGLMEVLDDHLDEAAKQLAEEDSQNYRDILLNMKGPVAGKNTRIGIVPLGLTFEQFASRFHNIMSAAVTRYTSINNDDPKGYAYNLVKINASESAFRHRVPGTTAVDAKSETYPINIIRSLMVQHLSPVKNLEIIASVRSDLPRTIAMRSWAAKVLDSQASILLLTFERIGRIVSGSILHDKMKNKEFDQMLFSRYNARTLTEFARQIQGMLSSMTEDKALDRLTKDVSSIVRSSVGARLKPEDIQVLSKAILDKAKNIDNIIAM